MPVLQKALAASSAQPPPAWTDPYEAERQRVMARLAAGTPPEFGPEEAGRRRAQNQTEYELGLLGTLSGQQQLQDVGGMVLKRALAQREPRATERGSVDPLTGQFTYSPDFLRRQDESALSALESKSAAARGTFDAERRQHADRQELQRQRAEDMQELRRITAAQGQVGAFQPAGFTAQGESVVTNTRSGANYIMRMGPDGVPQHIPYAGMYTPKASFEKDVAAAGEQLDAAASADRLLAVVRQNPDAFSPRAAAVSAVPGPLQGYAAQVMGLTQEQQAMRAAVVREAAIEINRLYGAALSMGESARAATFLPNAEDPPEALIAKLQSARDWAHESARRKGPAALNAAAARQGGMPAVLPQRVPLMGPGAGQPAPPGAGLSPAELAELAQLRQRFGPQGQQRGP